MPAVQVGQWGLVQSEVDPIKSQAVELQPLAAIQKYSIHPSYFILPYLNICTYDDCKIKSVPSPCMKTAFVVK